MSMTQLAQQILLVGWNISITLYLPYRLLDHVTVNEQEDPLLNPTESNPFKDKKNCIIL